MRTNATIRKSSRRLSHLNCFDRLLILSLLSQAYSWLSRRTYVYLFFFPLLLLTGCQQQSDTYYPLQAGHLWEYRETLKIRNEVFERRKLVQSENPAEYEGKTLYMQQHQGGLRFILTEEVDGIYRLDKQLNSAHLVFPEPPRPAEPERRWKAVSRLGVIESRTFAREDRILDRPPELTMEYRVVSDQAQVTVPAGTFDKCVQIRGEGSLSVRTDRGNNSAIVNVTSDDWYAPGVGLVKTEREEQSDSVFLKPGRYTLELVYFE